MPKKTHALGRAPGRYEIEIEVAVTGRTLEDEDAAAETRRRVVAMVRLDPAATLEPIAVVARHATEAASDAIAIAIQDLIVHLSREWSGPRLRLLRGGRVSA